MGKNRNKRNEPREAFAHALPVVFHVNKDQSIDINGWLVIVECESRANDVVPIKGFDLEFRRAIGHTLPSQAERANERIWWMSDTLMELKESAAKLAAQRLGYDFDEWCPSCWEGHPCDSFPDKTDIIWSHFTPRDDLEPHVLDPESAQAIAEELIEAGPFAMTLLQEALAIYDEMRAPPVTKIIPTLPLPDAVAMLDVPWPCDREQMEHAFKKAVKQHHPDAGGSEEAMARANEARLVLLREIERTVST